MVHGVMVDFLTLTLPIGISGTIILMHGIVSVGDSTVHGDITVGDGASTIHFSHLLIRILAMPFTLAIHTFMVGDIGAAMLITINSIVLVDPIVMTVQVNEKMHDLTEQYTVLGIADKLRALEAKPTV